MMASLSTYNRGVVSAFYSTQTEMVAVKIGASTLIMELDEAQQFATDLGAVLADARQAGPS